MALNASPVSVSVPKFSVRPPIARKPFESAWLKLPVVQVRPPTVDDDALAAQSVAGLV